MAGPSRILYRCLALVSVLCVAIAVPRVALRVEPGLSGTYLIPASAAPAFTTVDAEQSTAQLERRWPALTPDVFRVEWTGYLGVDADDTYTFTLVADEIGRAHV